MAPVPAPIAPPPRMPLSVSDIDEQPVGSDKTGKSSSGRKMRVVMATPPRRDHYRSLGTRNHALDRSTGQGQVGRYADTSMPRRPPKLNEKRGSLPSRTRVAA